MITKNRYSSLEECESTSYLINLVQDEGEDSDLPKARQIDDFQDRDCANIYLCQISKIPLLSLDEEIFLFQIVRDARNAEWHEIDEEQVNRAKRRIVEGNLRLVAKIAMRYRNLGLSFLDLVQEGNVGLMKSVEKFELSKGYRFTTYATWWIQQSMMRALTDHSRTIRLPAHIVERLGKLNKSKEYLQKKNNEQPTIEEVAQEMRLPIEKARQALELAQGLASLDMPINDQEDRNCFIDLIQNESASSPEEDVLVKTIRERLNEVLDTLLPREAEILRLRFGLSDGTFHTLEQLGSIFGITRERVRQIEKKALSKLRHPKRSMKLKEFLD